MSEKLFGGAFEEGRLQDGDRCAAADDHFVALELVEKTSDGFARRAGHIRQLFMSERHGEAQLCRVAIAVASPVKEQPGKTTGGRAGERQPARIQKDFLVFPGKNLRSLLADLAVGFEKAEEVIAADALQLGRSQRLGGNFIGHMIERRAQSKNISRTSDLQDQGAAFSGSR